MKLEMKNIKISKLASQETVFYTATLYVDGKKEANIGNDGFGGCDHYHSINKDNDRFVEINNWCKANLPKWEMGGKTFETDLEMWCSEYINKYETTKDIKRDLRNKLLIIDDGEIYTFKVKKGSVWQQYQRAIMEKYPDCKILNALPADEAVSIVLEAVA